MMEMLEDLYPPPKWFLKKYINNFLLQNGILKTSYEFQTFIGQRCLILRVMLQFKLPLYNYSVIFN